MPSPLKMPNSRFYCVSESESEFISKLDAKSILTRLLLQSIVYVCWFVFYLKKKTFEPNTSIETNMQAKNFDVKRMMKAKHVNKPSSVCVWMDRCIFQTVGHICTYIGIHRVYRPHSRQFQCIGNGYRLSKG